MRLEELALLVFSELMRLVNISLGAASRNSGLTHFMAK